MPSLVLALIDAVFALACHHNERARRNLGPEREPVSVRAEVRGPEIGEPVPGGLTIRVIVTAAQSGGDQAPSEEAVTVYVDLRDERLLALDLAFAELPLDRSSFARLVGELEAWCYDRIPTVRES